MNFATFRRIFFSYRTPPVVAFVHKSHRFTFSLKYYLIKLSPVIEEIFNVSSITTFYNFDANVMD